MSYSGRCLCGAVRYALEGELAPIVNCHCQYCRRAHGSAFSTVSTVPAARFRIVEGEDLIRGFETPGVGIRSFCSRCGTRLFNQGWENREIVSVVVSTLDQDPKYPPVCHVNLESKASWYEILDDLPRYDGFPPRGGAN